MQFLNDIRLVVIGSTKVYFHCNNFVKSCIVFVVTHLM